MNATLDKPERWSEILCCNSRHCPHRLRLQDNGGITGSEVVGSEDKSWNTAAF